MRYFKNLIVLLTPGYLLLSGFGLALLISSCGGTVPPLPKKAGTAPTENPLVESTIPADLEANVALNRSVSVIFSKAMSAVTVENGTNFVVRSNPGAVLVAGTVTLTGNTAVFRPTVNFSSSTVFTATVNTGVQDLNQNPLLNNKVWTFTTDAPGTEDTVAPTLISTDPPNGATNVSTNSDISVTFSEAIDHLTVTVNSPDNTDSFNVSGGAKTVVDLLASEDRRTFTFVVDPAKKLDFSKTYDVTITTGVKDLSGNPLAFDVIWSFTTRAEGDDD